MRASYRTDFEVPRWRTFEGRLMPGKKLNKFLTSFSLFKSFLPTRTENLQALSYVRLSGDVSIFPRIIGSRHFFSRDLSTDSYLTNSTGGMGRLAPDQITRRNTDALQQTIDKRRQCLVWYVGCRSIFIEEEDIRETFTNRIWIRLFLGYKLNQKFQFEMAWNFQDSKNTVESDDINYDGIIRLIVKHSLN